VKLQGRTALITDSDSGIGRAIATTFAREGANVGIHYLEDERVADQTANAARSHGVRAEVFQADLSDPAGAERLWTEVTSRLGAIDILVNNAG